MGGAVALLASLQQPGLFAGLLLFAPMCGIDATMQPHPLLVKAGE
jgi:alpha-beta hydrolase superfamily lysophospholipase